MSVLVDKDTRLLVQGITGNFGGFHARLSLDYGTTVAAGVTPGKGGPALAKPGARLQHREGSGGE